MKKILFAFVLFYLFLNYNYAASCYPNGVTFSTQAEIEDFFYYDVGGGTVPIYCSEIGGDVIIEGNDINNLDGLEHLTKIDGALIIRNCPRLTSFEGLKNLESIGGKFEINNIEKKWTLFGLSALTSIGGDLIIKNNEHLSTLTGGSFGSLIFPGLSNVTSIGGGIFIESNPLLTKMDGLSGVASISGHISIKYNDELDNISDLSGITTGVVAIRIVENPLLTSLDGLQNINSTGGGILIENNNSLTDLSGLEGIHNIGWHLYIKTNGNLQNLQGLNNLQTIGKEMRITNNPKLLNLSGLNNLQTIGELFEISGNDLLNSLSALSNLTAIGGSLSIETNPQLQTLQGINNIDYTTISFLSLRSDYQLSTCDVTSICNFLDSGGNASIVGNAIGCSTIAEVQESCSPPECTTITYPADDEHNVPLDVTITWNSVNDANGYKINIVIKDETTGNIISETTTDVGNNTSYFISFDCKSSVYVRIFPYNEHGDQIDCPQRHFTTTGANIELTGDVEICYGDTVQLNAYFDEGTIEWSPADYLNDNSIKNPLAFPSETTTYFATVTDENGYGCTATDSVTVTVYPPDLIYGQGSVYLCKNSCNGTIHIMVDGNFSPITYLWNTGDTTNELNNLCAGNYSLTATNSMGCKSTIDWNIHELPPIQVTIENLVNVTDSTKGSIDVSIDNQSRAYGLEWIGMGDLNYQSNEEDIDSLEAGCYQLVVWDSLLNCSMDTTICIEDKTTGINDISLKNNLVKIYPNPAYDIIQILPVQTDLNIKSIELFDISGKIMLKETNIDSNINISDIEEGLYFVKIKLERETIYKKVVIAR